VRLGPRALPRLVGAGLSVTLITGTAVAAVGLRGDTVDTRAGVAVASALESLGASASPTRRATEPQRERLAAPLGTSSPSPVPSPSDPPAVAPLQALHAADLMVTLPAPLSPEQVSALQALAAVTGVAVVDTGTVKIAGQDTRLVGVDPGQFRQFTPQQTAESDALWEVVARGEVTVSHALAGERGLELGAPVDVAGQAEVSERLGALASYGLPEIEAVTDKAGARELGVVPDSGVLLSAPEREMPSLRKAVEQVVGTTAEVTVLRPEKPKPVSVEGKPKNYRELYIDSARYCPGLDWRILASIGQIESGHGKNLGPSSAGALGPMQFMPATWAAYGVDGDGDGAADIMNPFDAVPSAASYLCRSGATRGEQGLYSAIFAYNHADWYVRKVLALAAQIR
jgi:hypothetical protein